MNHRIQGVLAKTKRHKFAVLKGTARHDGLAENTKMDFGHHVNGSGEHVPCVGFEVVVGKRCMEVRKRITVLSSGEVALQRDEFAPSFDGHAVVPVVVVHVAVGAFPSPSNAAGDGGRIKAKLIGQALQGGVDFFAWVKPHKHVITASGPFHEHGLKGEPLRVPFIRLQRRNSDSLWPAPWL